MCHACHHRGYVNYAGTRIYGPVARFWPQIKKRAGDASRTFVAALSYNSAQSFAIQRVLDYEKSGQIADWEEMVKGNPDQVDRYVMQALRGDLWNYGDKLIRAAGREVPHSPEVIEYDYDKARSDEADAGRYAVPSIEIYGDPESVWYNKYLQKTYPYLWDQHIKGYSVREVAKNFTVSVATAKRRIAAEKAAGEQERKVTGKL